MIKYDDFQKMDIRLGKILDVEKVENADKLYKLQVDFISEKRQVVAGIADKFSESELKDKLFPFVFNMELVEIRGVESQAMILVVEDELENLALLMPSKDLKPGSKIV